MYAREASGLILAKLSFGNRLAPLQTCRQTREGATTLHPSAEVVGDSNLRARTF